LANIKRMSRAISSNAVAHAIRLNREISRMRLNGISAPTTNALIDGR